MLSIICHYSCQCLAGPGHFFDLALVHILHVMFARHFTVNCNVTIITISVYSVCTKSISCSSFLEERPLSFSGFSLFFPVKGFHVELFLIQIEGLKMEGAVRCTDFKVLHGKCVIFWAI